MTLNYNWKLEVDPGEELDEENIFLYKYIVQVFEDEGKPTAEIYAFHYEEIAMKWAENLATNQNKRCSVYKELAATVNRWDD